jgi:hypothetical protein
LEKLGKSIGDFNTYVTTFENIIGELMKHLGTNLWDIPNYIGVFTGWGTMGIVVGLHGKII